MLDQKNKLYKKIIEIITAPQTAIVVGAVLLSISLSHWYFRYQALSFGAELVEQYSQSQIDDLEKTPAHINIPWFVDTNISTEVFAEGQWTISEKQASYLSQSAKPGEQGNIIIYGHNTREILGNIRALKGSEIITLKTIGGDIHTYQISKIVEVNPDEVSYLQPTQSETLTLYTCSGFLDSKRFIVQAEPVLIDE